MWSERQKLIRRLKVWLRRKAERVVPGSDCSWEGRRQDQTVFRSRKPGTGTSDSCKDSGWDVFISQC